MCYLRVCRGAREGSGERDVGKMGVLAPKNRVWPVKLLMDLLRGNYRGFS